MHKLGARMIASTAALGLAATSVALAVPAQSAAPADPATSAAKQKKNKNKKDETLKVMTLNLYLGGSLGKVIEAIADGGDIFGAANTLMDTAIATDFPKRAKWIAKTVKKENPDVITLNELTNWVTNGALPDYDYLDIFLDALKKKGMKFKVASLVDNADIGLDIGGTKNPIPYTGTYPGCEAGAAEACGWRLQDRDAVLYNKKTKKLKLLKGAKQGNYADQQTFSALGATVDFNRGWASARMKYMGKKFTMMTSHLEVESTDGVGDPDELKSPNFANWPSAIQVSQGNELVAAAKSFRKKTDGRVIVAGDFNTDANGYYSPTYANMTKFLNDSWKQAGKKFGKAKGATCCHLGDLDSTTKVAGVKGAAKYLDSGDPVIPTRIDLVLSKKAKATKVAVLGTKQASKTQPKWESDHFFYSADVKLK